MSTRDRKYESERLENSIRQLLDEGNSRNKIAELLGVHVRTVARYIQNIHKQDKTKWSEIANESLENRAILIKEYYEKIAKKAEKIVDDPEVSAKDLDTAGKLLIACHKNVYHMIKYGPLKFQNIVEVQGKELEDKSNDTENQ